MCSEPESEPAGEHTGHDGRDLHRLAPPDRAGQVRSSAGPAHGGDDRTSRHETHEIPGSTHELRSRPSSCDDERCQSRKPPCVSRRQALGRCGDVDPEFSDYLVHGSPAR